MAERSGNLSGYRFGFNGQEADNEVYGVKQSYTAEFWQYDTRLGRRWNVDPVTNESESSYIGLSNNPIWYCDPNGDFKTKFGAWLYKIFHGGTVEKDKGGEYYVGKRVEMEGTKNPNKALDELDEAVVAYQRRFDWKGRSEGKDLEYEKLKEAWKTNYEWTEFLIQSGFDYSITDNIQEARLNMLQLGTLVLIPNPIIKSGTAIINDATKTTKAAMSTTERLQSYVSRATKEVDALGDAAFTPKQLQAIQRNPNLRAMYRGNRIDIRVRQLIKNDPILAPLKSNYTRGADFVDPVTGNWWDMTTPGSWPSHVNKYGPGGTLLRTQ